MNNINIQQLEQMLPDYISGSLGSDDRKKVENALLEYPLLRERYDEFKRTFEYVNTVKFEEPSSQYWNTLLPRIHDKLEQRQQRRFSLPVRDWWKVLVPVAAVILIFIIYKTFIAPAPEITKEQNIENKISNPDTIKKELMPESKEKIITEVKKENKVKKIPANKKMEAIKPDNPRIVNEEPENGKDEEIASSEFLYNITSPADDVEVIYEESETEYNKLTSSEKSEVLDKLKEIEL